MHQNAFGGQAPPGPAGGAYSAPPDPLAGLKGGGEGEMEEGGEEMKKAENPPTSEVRCITCRKCTSAAMRVVTARECSHA